MNARLLALVAAAGLAGCTVDNDASVRVYGMCFPPEPTDTGLCAYDPTCGTLWLGSVVADVASSSAYGPLVWPMQVDNLRPSNADRAGGVETAIAWIEGYKVSYSTWGLSAVPTIPSADVAISRHPVQPEGSTVVIVPVVPAAVGTVLYDAMGDLDILDFKATIRAYGHYADGSRFETGEFQVVGKLTKNAIPAPTSANTCFDPTKPVYVGTCPQPLQSGVFRCISAGS